MAEQRPIVLEDRFAPWDRWFENRIYPSPDGIAIYFTEVTERKRAEAELSRQKRFVERLVDAEPGTLYVYDLVERRNVFIHRDWVERCGYSAEETGAMGAALMASHLHPDDLAAIVAHHDRWRSAHPGELREIGYRMRTKAGEWRWLESREVAFERDADGRVTQILGVVHDVTEDRLTRAALAESEDRFRDLVEPSELLTCTHALVGRILSVNPWASRSLGYPVETLTRMNLSDLLAPEARAGFEPYLAKLLRDGEARGTLRVVTAAGEPRNWEYHNTLRTEGVAEPVVRGTASTSPSGAAPRRRCARARSCWRSSSSTRRRRWRCSTARCATSTPAGGGAPSTVSARSSCAAARTTRSSRSSRSAGRSSTAAASPARWCAPSATASCAPTARNSGCAGRSGPGAPQVGPSAAS
jgi:PAS domain S-box-containing protein